MRERPSVSVLNLEQSIHQAMALQDQGRLGAAAKIYKAILKKLPDQFEALHFFGLLRAQQGKFRDAAKLFSAAVRSNPSSHEAHNNLGNTYQKLERFEAAIEAHRAAVALDPRFATAHYNLGLALARLERFDEAIDSYRMSLSLRPGSPQALTNLGTALRALKRDAEAIDCFEEALRIQPNSALALNNLGNVLAAQNRPSEALECYSKAVALDPSSAEIRANLGTAQMSLEDVEAALESYAAALSNEPDLKPALIGRARALRAKKNYAEAIADLDNAKRSGHLDAEGLSLLVRLKREACDWTGLAELENRVVENVRSGISGTHPFGFLAIAENPADQLACGRLFADQNLPKVETPLSTYKPYGHERLKIGYLSADFCEHPTSQLAVGLFEEHDRMRFETFAFSFSPDDGSDLRERVVAAFDHFIDVRDLSSAKAAQKIRDLEIDIAVDMSAYTENTRLDILAHRPAPIQTEFLVFPGTLGSDLIDYMFVDETVAPGEHRSQFAEHLVHLPGSYQVSDAKRAVAEIPSRANLGLPEDGFVFCALNAPYKLTPRFFAIWMALLGEVPGSALWLLGGHHEVESNLKQEAEAAGVAPERLVFAGRLAASDHMARLRQADLFLDCLPYGGHTTANEALFMGLPVLTRMGEAFAGRVAASLLNALGLPELVTTSDDDYRETALRLAREPAALTALRERLAASGADAELFDAARFARHMEAAFVEMQRRLENGQTPAPFNVADIM